MTSRPRSPTQWTIHDERVVDDSRRVRLSIASVELPDGTTFEQYVLRMQRAAIVAVVDDDRVLMLWRHRFIIDRWVWELPGGYVDNGEDPAVTAAREVEEETGWRVTGLTHIGSVQPMVGSADAANELYVAHGANRTGNPPDPNEAERISWLPLSSIPERIAKGEIVGAASIICLNNVLAERPRSGGRVE